MKTKMTMVNNNFSCSEWLRVSETERNICATHMTSVPVNVGQLASELGLQIFSSTLPTGVSGEIRPVKSEVGKFFIRVNRHEKKTRQRFTVAHEIGHFLLHKDLINEGIVDSVLYRSATLSSTIEAQANRIAADILMPRKTIREWLALNNVNNFNEEFIPYLSKKLKVSKVALKIRFDL